MGAIPEAVGPVDRGAPRVVDRPPRVSILMSSIFRTKWAELSLAAAFALPLTLAGCTADETPTATPAGAGANPAAPAGGSMVAPGEPVNGAPAANPMPAPAEPAKNDADKAAPPAGETAPKIEQPKGADAPKAAADSKLSEEEIANVKKLPADAQSAAMAQMVCPVSGDHLGAMDVPIKTTAEGKSFYLCCKSCQKEVDAHPAAVVAKLAAAK